VCPPGTAALGTVVVPCFSAPSEALVACAPWTAQALVSSLHDGGGGGGDGSSSGGPSLDHVHHDDTTQSLRGGPHPTAAATGFIRVWADGGSRSRKNLEGTMAIWRPIPPAGYVAVGSVVTPNHFPPEPRDVACVRADLAQASAPAPAPLWTVYGSGEKLGGVPLSLYRTGVAAGAGWTALASHARDDAATAPAVWEIRWDVDAGARVDDSVDGDDGDDQGADDASGETPKA